MGPWRIPQVLVAVAVVLFIAFAFSAWSDTRNWNEGILLGLGLAAFAASFLPWRSAP